MDLVLVGGELVGQIEVFIFLDSEDISIDEEESFLDAEVATLLACPVLDRLWILDRVVRVCGTIEALALLAWTRSGGRLVLEIGNAPFESRYIFADVIGARLEAETKLHWVRTRFCSDWVENVLCA